MISILLPTLSRMDLFPQAYGSLLVQMCDYELPYEIIVVNDNLPDNDPVAPVLNRLGIKWIRGPHRGSAAVFETAANCAQGDFLLFINDDMFFFQPFIKPMLEMSVEYDIVGAKLLYENMTIQHGGMEFLPEYGWTSAHKFRGLPNDLPEANEPSLMPCVTFSLTLVKKGIWDELNGFDGRYMGENYSDTDFCLRALQAGYKICYEPRAVAIHYESATRGHNLDVNTKTFQIFQSQWVQTGKLEQLLKEKGLLVKSPVH